MRQLLPRSAVGGKDLDALRAEAPAITINKIISTISTILPVSRSTTGTRFCSVEVRLAGRREALTSSGVHQQQPAPVGSAATCSATA